MNSEKSDIVDIAFVHSPANDIQGLLGARAFQQSFKHFLLFPSAVFGANILLQVIRFVRALQTRLVRDRSSGRFERKTDMIESL